MMTDQGSVPTRLCVHISAPCVNVRVCTSVCILCGNSACLCVGMVFAKSVNTLNYYNVINCLPLQPRLIRYIGAFFSSRIVPVRYPVHTILVRCTDAGTVRYTTRTLIEPLFLLPYSVIFDQECQQSWKQTKEYLGKANAWFCQCSGYVSVTILQNQNVQVTSYFLMTCLKKNIF